MWRVEHAVMVGLLVAATPPWARGQDDCTNCIPVNEGTFVGTTNDNTASSASLPSCLTSSRIDEWYCYTATCDGIATASLCGSGFDTTLAVYDVPAGACPGTELACDDDFCTFPLAGGSQVQWLVRAGTTYYLRVAGFQAATGDYTLRISCELLQPGTCSEARTDFEDLTSGTVYPYGDTFTTNGVSMAVREFFFGPLGCVNPYYQGQASVGSSGVPCGSGNELAVNNVNVEMDFGGLLTDLKIGYFNGGGNINLRVNGVCVNSHTGPGSAFSGLPPLIGGVSVLVAENPLSGGYCGTISLSGSIESFEIGGQELWIDDINCTPEDDTPPIAVITSPVGLDCTCTPVTIVGSAYDPDGFDNYVLEYRPILGGSWTFLTSSTVPVINGVLYVWDAGALAQGFYMLRLTATNSAGLVTQDVSAFFLDKQFDTVAIGSPGDGQILGGTVCLDGTVWDRCFLEYTAQVSPIPAGVFEVIDPNNPTYGNTVTNNPLGSWDSTGAPDGDYRLRVEGTDICDHSKVDTVDITIDNTPPTAVITDPVNCQQVGDLVTIRGTANDANLSGWVLQYTGGANNNWVTLASSVAPVVDDVLWVWDTTGLEACCYTLRLRATDKAIVNCNGAIHHTSEFHVSVHVGPCPAAADALSPLGVGILAALLLVTGMVLMRRRQAGLA